MRILLALDGSHGAATAHALVSSLPWPAGTHLDVVRVVEPAFDTLLVPSIEFDGSIEDLMGAAALQRELEASIEDLAADDRTVEVHVVVGRPATIITELAKRQHSDLIVMGSRGRGEIRSMVLGSVSAEVADHAPCPLLIARTPACHRVVVALDGTPFADRMVETVGDLEVLRGVPIDVLAVAPSPSPGPGVMLSGVYGMPITWYEDGVETARLSLEAVAHDGALRLRARGFDAIASLEEGDPATRIIEHAAGTGADAIVIGTHGRTGMTRLLLGSVARKVLTHAHASVLLLREPHPTTAAGEPPEAVGAAR